MALGFLRVDFRWDFDEADLNESAKALFHRLDQVFDILDAPGFAFLSTIELDAEAGRFRGRTLRSTALLAGWRPLLRCTPLPRRPCLRNKGAWPHALAGLAHRQHGWR